MDGKAVEFVAYLLGYGMAASIASFLFAVIQFGALHIFGKKGVFWVSVVMAVICIFVLAWLKVYR